MSLDDYIFKNTGINSNKDQKILEYNNNKIVTNLPIGITTPLKKGYRNNESLFKMHFDLFDQLEDNLKKLLMTKKGERLGFSSFGTNLNDIFSQSNINISDIEDQAMREINSAVSKFLPFINLINFSSKVKEDLSNNQETSYEIIIKYTVPGLSKSKIRSLSLILRTSN